MARKKFRCECGQQIQYPYPKKCPNCGAEFVGINTRGTPLILTILSIFVMLAVLILLIVFLVQSQS